MRTLGELAALPAEAIADRFGELGLRALRLARGDDEPLRPRRPPDEIESRLGLPEAASGQQLEHALELLVERLLAHPAAGERTIRRLRIEARLAARRRLALRGDAAQRQRQMPSGCWLALAPRLGELPGPASWLGLRALELGPEAGEQGALARAPAEERRERLTEAVRQVRSAAGRDAVLRVLEIDPGSRVPERRAILAPVRIRAGWPLSRALRSTGPGRSRSTPNRTARRLRSAGSRWSRCASGGWSRTAGGRPKPLQRKYFEVVLADGRDLVVFREPPDGERWYEQRA